MKISHLKRKCTCVLFEQVRQQRHMRYHVRESIIWKSLMKPASIMLIVTYWQIHLCICVIHYQNWTHFGRY